MQPSVKEKTFTCVVCSEKFDSELQRLRHLASHVDAKKCVEGEPARVKANHLGDHPCPVCARVFLKKEHLAAHMFVHAGKEHFCCDLCGKEYTRKGHLLRHMLNHSPGELQPSVKEKTFKCVICSEKFDSELQRLRHLASHVGAKKCAEGEPAHVKGNHLGDHPCPVCARVFLKKEHLGAHMFIHTGKEHFCCDVCDREYTRRGHLLRHMLNHSPGEPNVCNICCRGFADNLTFTQHMLDHGTTPQAHEMRIRECGKQKLAPGAVEEKESHQCKICGRVFSDGEFLASHEYIHSDKEFQVSEMYGEKVSSEPPSLVPSLAAKMPNEISENKDLPKKLRTHATGKSAVSKVSNSQLCEKKVLDSNVCRICNTTFSTMTDLLTHVLTHTCDVLHECKMCSRKFSTMSELSVHVVEHMAEKHAY